MKFPGLLSAVAAVGVLFPGLLGGAEERPSGLSQRIDLPRYRMWIADPQMSELRTDVVTPHTPWARPYAGGVIKVVVIAPRWTQRATVELQQRFDFDAAAVMPLFSGAWGDPDNPVYAWHPYGTEAFVTERALAELRAARQPEVIVLGWMSGAAMPAEVRQGIADAVGKGAGLVIFNPQGPLPEEIAALIKQGTPVTGEQAHAVVDGIPSGYLPPLPPAEARSLVGQGVKLYRDGSNRRLAVVDYAPLGFGAYDTVECYLSPPGAKGEGVRDIHYDYYCSLAGRCILWAADRMPGVRLAGWENLSGPGGPPHGPASLGVLRVEPAARMPAGASAELVIRDADEAAVEYRSPVNISPDGSLVLVTGPLKSGSHYADIFLRDAQGRTLDWGSKHFVSDSGAQITSLEDGPRSHKPEQPLHFSISLAGALAGTELAAEVVDNYGRTLWSSTAAAKPQVSFRADVSGALSTRCEIRATLSRADIVLAQKTLRILILRPRPEPDRYLYAAWASADPSFIMRRVARVMAEQGITTGILSGDPEEWAQVNARPTPYMTRHYPENSEKGLVVRKPCLTDPAFLEEETAKLRTNAEKYRPYSPPVYSLGDDVGMMLTHQDGCVSPTCLDAFRQYLARQYGRIKALNASWGTSYASFGQVMPLSLEEALQQKKYPAWADHRMYMDELFVKTHRDAKGIIRGVDPDAPVGFEGPLSDDSWYGYAWPELMAEMDLMVPYPNAWKFDIVRSFARPGLIFGGWFGGYAMYRNPEDTSFYPWYLLFNGCNSYWFFCDYGNSTYGHPAQGVAPDLRVLPVLQETTKQVNRIQEGIDRLVLGAERRIDGTAVYFSRPSQHAATLMPPVPTRDFNTDPAWPNYLSEPTQKWAMNVEATLRLLDDMGLSHVFVDRADIAAGALQKRGFRLLVMPFLHAVSAPEAGEIEKFVNNGGVVLADVRPALFDPHLKPLGKGRLDTLFGVKRRGSVLEPLREEMVRPGAGSAAIPMPVDPTVAAAEGRAATVTASGIPVFISKTCGQGRTCLLNLALQHYLTLRAAGKQTDLKDYLASWLASAGIFPEVQARAVDSHNAPLRVFHYRDGQARLIGLLRPHKRLMDEPEAFVDRSPRKFSLQFPEAGHVYDVIHRSYCGETDRMQLEIPTGQAFLLAVLPYQVEGINAHVNSNGKTVTVFAEVVVSPGSNPGRHVVNLRVTDAAGRPRPEYGKPVMALHGRASHSFSTALNDPEGRWMFDLEDIATGVKSSLLENITPDRRP